MPELPEVETVRLQLLRFIKGKKITDVAVYHEKSVGKNRDFKKIIANKVIDDIRRRGKLLIFSFKKFPNLFLLGHLKMTGQFFYLEKGQVKEGGGHSMRKSDFANFPGRHTRVGLTFSGGHRLYFNDMRLFGYLKLVNGKELIEVEKQYGPEPIDDGFNDAEFFNKLKKTTRSIKAVLLDQSVLAGVGNIYADEALFMASIKPTRRANKLSKKEAAALRIAASNTMKEAIKLGGTTFQSFLDSEGKQGNFRSRLKVFGKTGESCPKCKTPIKKIRVAGRGTHYCPKCQRG